MAIIGRDLYDEERFKKFENMLRANYENNNPVEYEIIVDNFKVIRRTSNPDAFNSYDASIFPNSKMIELVIYHGASNNNDRYIFALKEDYLDGSHGLSGFEVDKQITEKLEKLKKDMEFKKLQDENESLRQEVGELDRELATVRAEKQEMIDSQNPLAGIIGEIGSSLLTTFVKNNPAIVNSLPGGAALAGYIGTENKPHSSDSQTEPEISFKKSPSASSQELGEEEKASILFVSQLRTRFIEQEFDKILQILESLAKDKSGIDKVLAQLNHLRNEQVQI